MTITKEDCLNKCLGMSSKTHEEIVIKLTRIETGQEHLFSTLDSLNKTINKISVQEEKLITLKSRMDAAWIKIDTIKEAHDKCPIKNLQTQIGWIWVFLSSLALGLAMMFINNIVGLP